MTLCAKVILMRCMFRHLKRRAILVKVKEVVEIVQLQHPLVYDQQDPCALAMEGDLKNPKLCMLPCGCEDMGLDIPLQLVRGKAPNSALLKYFTNNCTWRKYS